MPRADAGRVIAGTARGVRLEAPRAGTRPLSDRVKQALFGVLEADGALADGFLDLFAGTGAGGIEALSRGATRATFVERDAAVCALIESNLRRAALTGGRVVRADVLRYLGAGPHSGDDSYLAALVDPPYDQLLVGPALERLGDRSAGWLAPGALVVAKHFWRSEPPPRVGTLKLDRQRRFGETVLSFYRLEEQA
jgi:16S rRNA (guanine966-N2)-methyltransferase